MSHTRGQFKAIINGFDGWGGCIEEEVTVSWDYSHTVDILTVLIDGEQRFVGGPRTAAAVKKAIEQSEEKR